MREILKLPRRPTAVVAVHDKIAFSAMEAVREAGLRIPEDMAITSIDDVAESAHTRPPLTTFRIPRAEAQALIVTLGGMDEDALARFRRGNMGVVFQSFHLIPTMTALENVAIPLELARAPDTFDRARAELVAVGLGHRMDHYPSQLSGGEQQRVALARAAAPRPAILLADEPTGNLDATNGQAIMDLLFGLRDRHGATLVLVTHAPELAARCDRVIRLDDGRLAA